MSAVTTTKAPTKFASLVSVVRKADPKTDDGVKSLHMLAVELGNVSTETEKDLTATVKALDEQLADTREELGSLITRRTTAIDAALEARFPFKTIQAEFKVSGGTVAIVSNARKFRAALKAGGNTNPPSVASLTEKVSNPGRIEGGVAAMISHAEKTGEILKPAPTETEKAETKAPTVTAVLKRAESLSDALARVEVKDGDADSIAQLLTVLANATARTKAALAAHVAAQKAAKAEQASAPVPTPKDVRESVAA